MLREMLVQLEFRVSFQYHLCLVSFVGTIKPGDDKQNVQIILTSRFRVASFLKKYI